MMKILLIHGYATKLSASVFRKPLPDHEGFTGLKTEIHAGEVDVFHWGIHRSLSFIQSINPFSYIALYRDEERLMESLELQQKLFETISASGTERIICHSMGCRLLLNMIKTLGLPSSIRSIVFLQADIDRNSISPDVPTSPFLLRSFGATEGQVGLRGAGRLPSAVLLFTNFFCPWDPSLLASSILHKTIRIGMYRWKHTNVKNQFYPLLRPINLHTSPIRDERFVKRLLDE